MPSSISSYAVIDFIPKLLLNSAVVYIRGCNATLGCCNISVAGSKVPLLLPHSVLRRKGFPKAAELVRLCC